MSAHVVGCAIRPKRTDSGGKRGDFPKIYAGRACKPAMQAAGRGEPLLAGTQAKACVTRHLRALVQRYLKPLYTPASPMA